MATAPRRARGNEHAQLSLFGSVTAPAERVSPPADAWLTVQEDAWDVDIPVSELPAPSTRTVDSQETRAPSAGSDSRTRTLETWIADAASIPVRLVITDNRHTLLSWKPAGDGSALHVVRAHHMFLDAPERVARAVGLWMARKRPLPGEEKVLDRFMDEHRHLVTRDRRPLLPPRGRTHDLQEMFDRLNAAHFGGRVDATLGWGDAGTPRRGRRRTIQLGCYDPHARVITIHPALDQAFVPAFFVESVVFHEMLHEQIPAELQDDDRRAVHGPEFRRREEAYEHHLAALQWQQKHINKLLRFRPAGMPAPTSRRASRR